MIKASPDAGIPILTEIIGPDDLQQVPVKVPAPVNRPVPAESQAIQATSAQGLSETEWNRMADQVSERVLQQMLGRIDFVLEQRVRDSLADVLQIAVEGLATEIRQGLQQTLEEVIARAVTQEITRMQSTKK